MRKCAPLSWNRWKVQNHLVGAESSLLFLVGVTPFHANPRCPLLSKKWGYSSADAQGLTASGHLTAFLLCVGAAFFSDRFGKRGYVASCFSAIGTTTTGMPLYLVHLLFAGLHLVDKVTESPLPSQSVVFFGPNEPC
jgi:hypothetical protein